MSGNKEVLTHDFSEKLFMKPKDKGIIPNNSFTEFLLYITSSGKVTVEIFLRDENIWLTQAKIGELFGVDRTVVTKHLQHIYSEGELVKDRTSTKIARVQKEGNRQVTREAEYYNLDAILSVGYRVNSAQATQFRIWATERLKEYIIKGFTMDDERLKDPRRIFGKDYFEEQLARIRDIRSSERRMYQKSLIFIHSVVLIILQKAMLLKNFLQPCKINYTLPLLEKPLQKLSIKEPTAQNQI